MKVKKLLLGLSLGILCAFTNVDAKSAEIDFALDGETKVGDIINVSMNIDNVNDCSDGIVSVGGYLMYDADSLELVSYNTNNAPYFFTMNEDNKKLAGLDFTLENGINSFTNIYNFSFRVLNDNISTITLKDARLTDTKGYVDTTVESLIISPIKKEVKPIVVEEVKNIQEETIIAEIVNTTEEVVETKETNEEETIISQIVNAISEIVKSIFKLFR